MEGLTDSGREGRVLRAGGSRVDASGQSEVGSLLMTARASVKWVFWEQKELEGL